MTSLNKNNDAFFKFPNKPGPKWYSYKDDYLVDLCIFGRVGLDSSIQHDYFFDNYL